jgi:hypothetical protein
VHSEGIRDAGRDGLHNGGRIENDGNGDRQDEELHKPDDLASEQKEDRDDSDDAEEQGPEETLQISNKALGAKSYGWRSGEQVSRHQFSGGE